eukprot:2326226-Ditylum_brightwellii.AAC.1
MDWAQLNGMFNYDRMPLVPPGTKYILYEDQQLQGTWDVHRKDGWYIAPTMKHYRCCKIYMKAIGVEYVSDTVELFQYTCRY